MSISNRSSATGAATAATAKSAPSAPRLASQPTPERKRFSLSGPSRPLDLSHNAARRDLADVRLAGRWFAPHYAVPQPTTLAADTNLLAGREGEPLAPLSSGQSFAVLEVAGDWAWGYSEPDGRVGYVPVAALAQHEA